MIYTMKKIFIILMLFSVIISNAEELKVLYINHGKFWVDGKALYQGSQFSSNAKIRWEDEKQIVKVVNIKSHKVSVISAKTLIMGKMTTLSELLIQKQRLSSRDGILINIQSLIDHFNKPIALMNSICVETGVLLDENHFFFLQYEYGGETINKKLPINDHCFCINNDIYTIDGVPFSPVSLTSKLCYYEVNEKRVTTISDSLSILIEPRKDCTSFLNQYSQDKLSVEELQEMAEDYCRLLYPYCLFEHADMTSFCLNLQSDWK